MLIKISIPDQIFTCDYVTVFLSGVPLPHSLKVRAILYFILSQGGSSHMSLTTTYHMISAIAMSLVANFRAWDSVYWVEYCYRPSVVRGSLPYTNFITFTDYMYTGDWWGEVTSSQSGF